MGKPLPISHEELQHMQKVAESIALGAGKILLNYRGKAQITRSKKDALDIVTEADEASEKYILSELKRVFSTHGFLSEEIGERKFKSPYRWVIDPLDGTKDFARGLPLFFVNIALEYSGNLIVGIVYVPILSELYSCSKGNGAFLSGTKIHISSQDNIGRSMIMVHPPRFNIGSKLFNQAWKRIRILSKQAYRLHSWPNDIWSLCWVALGAREAFYDPLDYSKWWDIAPGILLVEEAGGKVTTSKGNPVTEESYKKEGLLASNGKIHDQLLKIIAR